VIYSSLCCVGEREGLLYLQVSFSGECCGNRSEIVAFFAYNTKKAFVVFNLLDYSEEASTMAVNCLRMTFMSAYCAVGMNKSLSLFSSNFIPFFPKTQTKSPSNGLVFIFGILYDEKNIENSRLVMQFSFFVHLNLARKATVVREESE
jgi:hypothetical protein